MNELHFGVCVGIDHYPGLPGQDLGSARRDAGAFRDWLVDPDGGGLPAENVALIALQASVDPPSLLDAHPQQREVNLALAGFNARIRDMSLEPDDWGRSRVYLYAAGHGIGPPDGEAAVLMADANRDLLGNNIELSRYKEWYLGCGLVHEVVILGDCCREIVIGAPPANAPPFSTCQFPTNKGTVTFTGYASRLGDAAWEPVTLADRDGARGYFTGALLDGLRGAAAVAGTGEVTAASLAQYVEQAVEERTRGVAPFPQRGELKVEGIPIVFRGPQAPAAQPQPEAPMRHVTIRFPGVFAGDVMLVDGELKVRKRWKASDGPWSLDLTDGLYQVITEPPGVLPFAGEGLFALAGVDKDVQL